MLEIDGLSVEEMRALDAYRQACALSDLLGELKRLKDVKNAALTARGTARLVAIVNGTQFSRDSACVNAQTTIDVTSNEISLRKEQAKILQTLLRSVPT